MLVKLVQPENALSSIYVTLSGIAMLVKLVQPKNALSPIYVTLSDITNFVTFFNASFLNTSEFEPFSTSSPYIFTKVSQSAIKLLLSSYAPAIN